MFQGQTETKKRLSETHDGRGKAYTTHKETRCRRAAVTLEIPQRSWATIMAGYYDKLKKKTGYNRDSVVQTGPLLSSGVETNYSVGRPC